MNRLALYLLLVSAVVYGEEHTVNDRKLQGLLLPMAAKAVVAKAVVAKAAVTGAVAVKAGAAVAAAVAANVPQVSVQQAPCQQVCKDVCSYSLERSCKTVPVTKQECAPVPRTTTQKQCSKDCQVTIGSGRKLKGVLVPLAAKALVAKAFVGKAIIAGVAAKAAVAGVAAKAAAVGAALEAVKPNVDCQIVCNDVPVTVNEIQCNDVTTDVEQCEMLPKQNCQQACLCIPMKQVSVTMPGHPL